MLGQQDRRVRTQARRRRLPQLPELPALPQLTGDDLWRLYSFYWRVLRERARIDKRRWQRHLGRIPRLIERDVIEAGLASKAFKQADVYAACDRARRDPHPFWAGPTVIGDLEALA